MCKIQEGIALNISSAGSRNNQNFDPTAETIFLAPLIENDALPHSKSVGATCGHNWFSNSIPTVVCDLTESIVPRIAQSKSDLISSSSSICWPSGLASYFEWGFFIIHSGTKPLSRERTHFLETTAWIYGKE